MKVKMKVNLSGTRDGVAWPGVGEVVDLPDAEAAHMLAAGMASRVGDAEVEDATAPQGDVETATVDGIITPKAKRATGRS